MKKLILLFSLIGYLATSLSAQQDAQYTQFMFNKLSLNPGYVVATETACISCLHRTQWLGLDGAPTSQSLNFRMPMKKKRVGLGVSINRDIIGPSQSLSGSVIYGYNIPIGQKGNLGFGIQGTIRSYRVNWNEITTIQSGDGAVPTEQTTQTLVNVGTGLYYYTPKYYVGLSVPHMIKNDVSLIADPSNNIADFSKEELHGFLMAGVLFNVSEKIKYKPAILLKYVKNSPFDADINNSLIFYDKLWLGATYRIGGFHDSSVGESVDFILQYQFSDPFKIGVAYDFTLSKVRNYNSGTFEVMLEYCMSPKNKNLTNPRFF